MFFLLVKESKVQRNGLISQEPQASSCLASTSKPPADELTSRIATRILNEIRPGTKYEVVSASEKQTTNMYSIAVTVDGQRFEASGPSKQKAKAAVAEIVLTELFKLKFDKLAGEQIMSECCVLKSTLFVKELWHNLCQSIKQFLVYSGLTHDPSLQNES